MKKKTYYIEIAGETTAESCLRELSQSEFELVSGIFDSCNSKYVVGSLEEVPSKVEFLTYLTKENLHSYDSEEMIKICKHFDLSDSAVEMLMFNYLYNN